MKTLKVKAIFTGQDGSLGYKKDKEYEIMLEKTGDFVPFSIHRKRGMGYCEYESIFSFLENWTDVRKL